MRSENRVRLLKAGTLVRGEAKEILDARSSVTLVLAGDRKIVVDTGLPGEGRLILEGLAFVALSPHDVDTVVNTHGHLDHRGNNDLFSNAEVLSGLEEGERIAPGVWIMETPGHTLDHISVVCEGVRQVVVAGDALPILGNYLQGVPPSLHVDKEMALASMSRIISIADIVVPGHDRPFSVSGRTYTTLD